MTSRRQSHWDEIYRARDPDEVSWYQARPELSLELIAAANVAKDAAIVDVGGGASNLVDALVAAGYGDLTVMDISEAALERARARLGAAARDIAWIAADVTQWSPPRRYALWHDRAVFHFLVEAEDRSAYVAALERGLAPGGHLIIATFALNGPAQCSGLPVMRYDTKAMARELGADFELVGTQTEDHVTPGGVTQSFLYQHYRRAAARA